MFLVSARFLIRVYLGVAMAALAVMMLTIVVDVFMRYAFNAPVVGAFDVVEICLVIVIFYGMGAAISGFHEIVIDLVDLVIPPQLVRFLSCMAGLLSATILVFLFISMLTPAMQAYRYGDMRMELNIPVWVIWIVALVGLCGGLLASIMNVLQPQSLARRTITSEAQ